MKSCRTSEPIYGWLVPPLSSLESGQSECYAPFMKPFNSILTEDPEFSAIRVLLIEDDYSFALSISKVLGFASKAVFSVEHVSTLEEGFRILEELPVDIVLLDLSLPDGHGLDSVSKVLERVSRAPVVVMTAQDETIALEALQLGVQDYIEKGSFELRALERVILYSLERHDLLQQIRDQRDLLDEKSRELQNSNEDLASMGYMLSHDLNEPLRVISSYLDLLRKKADSRLTEKEVEYLEIARDGANRMSTLIKELFEFSQIDRETSSGSVSLESILGEVKENLRVAILESGATIETGKMPHLDGCKTQFLILFQNLVGNAIRYKSAGIPPKIRIDSHRESDRFRISVSDNGIGIDPKFSQDIFELFRRLHAQDDYPGTGVGLATCKKIVERHGGRIWVESEKGKGSTFFLTLPRAVKKGA